jgi:magnesium-protoporphyrin IX monomethyl ester (oxidative) cyclase
MRLGQFILGLPGEKRETIRRTVAYAIDVDPDWAQFYCATPLPGTELRAQAEREGMIAGHQWSDLEFQRPSMATDALSAEELERARRRAYLAFYARARVARRLAGRLRLRDLGSVGGPRLVGSWVLDA